VFDVQPGTILVFADIGCPWAHLAVHRLHEARSRGGLDGRVAFDVHAFPLELINERPTPKHHLDGEIPVVGALDPEAGWSLWRRPAWEYPDTMLPAMEAVHAAKEQDLFVSDRLDRALRRAFFRDSRPISIHTEILAVASDVEALDLDALEDSLMEGKTRRRIFDDLETSRQDVVRGSPHVFLPDGTDQHNPGIEMHQAGEKGGVFPVIDRDDPSVYDELIARASA